MKKLYLLFIIPALVAYGSNSDYAGIFGVDDREDVLEPPAWMGLLWVEGLESDCTGFLVARNILISAQHCYVKTDSTELYTKDAHSGIIISDGAYKTKYERSSNSYESQGLIVRGDGYIRTQDYMIRTNPDLFYSNIGNDWIVVKLKNKPILERSEITKTPTIIDPLVLDPEGIKLPIDVEVIGYSNVPAQKSKCRLFRIETLPPTKQSPIRRLLHTDCDASHGLSGAALTTTIRDQTGHDQTRVIGLAALVFYGKNLTFDAHSKIKTSTIFVSVENLIQFLPNWVSDKHNVRIFGPDDRKVTTQPPSWTGLVEVGGLGGYYTGVYVAPNIVVTAQKGFLSSDGKTLMDEVIYEGTDSKELAECRATNMVSGANLKDDYFDEFSRRYPARSIIARGEGYNIVSSNMTANNITEAYRESLASDWLMFRTFRKPQATLQDDTFPLPKPPSILPMHIIDLSKDKLPMEVEVIGYGSGPDKPPQISKCKLYSVQTLSPTAQSPVRKLLHTDCDVAAGTSGGALTAEFRLENGQMEKRLLGILANNRPGENLEYKDGDYPTSTAFVSVENFKHLIPATAK